jgi:hypothetical protein
LAPNIPTIIETSYRRACATLVVTTTKTPSTETLQTSIEEVTSACRKVQLRRHFPPEYT